MFVQRVLYLCRSRFVILTAESGVHNRHGLAFFLCAPIRAIVRSPIVCRDCDWRDPEIYITLVLDIVYAYNALMLLFGLAHCCSLLCGELPSYLGFSFLLICSCLDIVIPKK